MRVIKGINPGEKVVVRNWEEQREKGAEGEGETERGGGREREGDK